MAGGGTLDILGEIQALVSDKLQVVSYKWLSRKFSVSSNYAKRLLEDFVEKHGNELEVLYTLSGWLKKNPQVYSVRLSSGLKFAVTPILDFYEEVKQEYKDTCSVQVYSVQACIPKDIAVLWSAEFVQAEELFNQPLIAENCLRDNRFCAVSNSFVKRIVDGKSVGASLPQPRSSSGVAVQGKTNNVLEDPHVQPPQQEDVGLLRAKNAMHPPKVTAVIGKSDKIDPKITDQSTKLRSIKESASGIQVSKNKNQNEKSLSGNGGSLANLWGRASAKPKPSSPIKDAKDVTKIAHTAEAQVDMRESADAASSDDDGHELNFKRESHGASCQKRRVVMDFSDDENEEENVVSLASPDPPTGSAIPDSLHNTEITNPDKKNLKFEEKKEAELDVKQTSNKEQGSELSAEGDAKSGSKTTSCGISLHKKPQSSALEGPSDDKIKDKANNSISLSPKRRKVLKTRIDERGREVTEVVWEGEAAGNVNTDDSMASNGTGNRAPRTNKAPAIDVAANKAPLNTSTNNKVPAAGTVPSKPAGKADNKRASKGGGKDPKQGNIMSFFKKI